MFCHAFGTSSYIVDLLLNIWASSGAGEYDRILAEEGGAAYQTGGYEDAQRSFDNAIDIDQQNATAWLGKGFALSALNKYDEAIESYNKSIEIESQNAFAWYAKASAQKALGRINESIESYDQSLKIDSQNKLRLVRQR